ncbi:MAG: cysteine--tRNA ligase [Candidatus Omnitrophica bacterium]|nr:cysteine--tRNA ligase [Candidatus Omnitrophota bacterium]
MLKIYDTLSKEKKEFIPINPSFVNMYTCGITSYDECHIGHARSLYFFDLVRRYLQYLGFKVRFVRNITDIDDKIINRAKELGINWKDLTEKYIVSYYEDLELLGIKKADYEPRATENIPDMIKYISDLIDMGYAYQAGRDVYFSVRKFPGYGKLSGQNIGQLLEAVRVEPNSLKKDPLDFALWKSSSQDEPFWESPWGRGRPGWHIECSVMSQKFLNSQTLDIHAGGLDLIFPHHENEIAQAEALTGKPFAKYWMHHGLLTINGQKMAKSLGNFVSIKDFIKKYDANFLKLLFLGAHYSQAIDYTEEKIKDIKLAFERILIFLDKVKRKVDLKLVENDYSIDKIKQLKLKFKEALDDDFNTPKALATLFELISEANKNMENTYFIIEAYSLLKDMADIFGLNLVPKTTKASTITSESFIISPITEEEIQAKILERQKAREQKDYKLADRIRKELLEKGIILEDTKEGTIWRRKL